MPNTESKTCLALQKLSERASALASACHVPELAALYESLGEAAAELRNLIAGEHDVDDVDDVDETTQH